MLKRLMALVFGLMTVSQSHAYSEKADLCVRYKKNYPWSEGHRVSGTLMDGSELNYILKTHHYNSYDDFAIIFWEHTDGVSLLKLDSRYLSSYSGTGAEDLLGRRWEVKKSYSSYGNCW